MSLFGFLLVTLTWHSCVAQEICPSPQDLVTSSWSDTNQCSSNNATMCLFQPVLMSVEVQDAVYVTFIYVSESGEETSDIQSSGPGWVQVQSDMSKTVIKVDIAITWSENSEKRYRNVQMESCSNQCEIEVCQKCEEPADINKKIAEEAKKHIGSKKFATKGCYKNKFCNKPKCNIFVAQIIEDACATVPHRWGFKWSPIGAGEWGNPKSLILTKKGSCWEKVDTPQVGDVVGSNGHCGIITAVEPKVLATNANADDVAENDNNGWATHKNAVYWRYKPKKW